MLKTLLFQFAFLLITIITLWSFFSTVFKKGYESIIPKHKADDKFNKIVIYFCSEHSIDTEQMSKIKDLFKDKKDQEIQVKLKTIWKNLTLPIGTKISKVSAIMFMFLLSILAFEYLTMPIFDTQLENAKPSFLLSLPFIVITTILAYYFRSTLSDLFPLDERCKLTKKLLIDLDFLKLNDDFLKLLQEQIKIDYDAFKTKIGFGGIIFLIFSSVTILALRLSSETFSDNWKIIIIIASTLFIKWVFESNRARIIYIALNAIILVRQDKLKLE